MPRELRLGSNAASALLWGAGSTLLRDVLQFMAMLAMVRLLLPEDYGRFALAQSMMGLISILSFGSFSMQVLQERDPDRIDWQAQYTAAIAINALLLVLSSLLAWYFWSSVTYHDIAWPLIGLSFVLIVDAPASLRFRMLETRHEWKRYRILILLGTLLGLMTGLILAYSGGGVWALVIQVPLFALPAAVDLFMHSNWRPDWSWSWQRWQITARFGFNRIGSASLIRGRQTVEQSIMTKAYEYATVGTFSRTIGLATLIVGRIGTLAMSSLYPVITRVEPGSDRFKRMSALVMIGICWTTLPLAGFLVLRANELVALLYGRNWKDVGDFLPWATIGVSMAGISGAFSSLLLALNKARICLWLDAFASVIGISLAILYLPQGIGHYLIALAGLNISLLLITLLVLLITGGVSWKAIPSAFLPSLLSMLAAAEGIELLRTLDYGIEPPWANLGMDFFGFMVFYLLVLRVISAGALRDLLDVVPYGLRIQKWMLLSASNQP